MHNAQGVFVFNAELSLAERGASSIAVHRYPRYGVQCLANARLAVRSIAQRAASSAAMSNTGTGRLPCPLGHSV